MSIPTNGAGFPPVQHHRAEMWTSMLACSLDDAGHAAAAARPVASAFSAVGLQHLTPRARAELEQPGAVLGCVLRAHGHLRVTLTVYRLVDPDTPFAPDAEVIRARAQMVSPIAAISARIVETVYGCAILDAVELLPPG